MTDREEREEHIKRLEAALACEEKQSSGKCSKQTCDDNCALLYEQGNWGEWKDTLRYAIESLKTDLKYDLLYEGALEQEPTTKNDLGVDWESYKDADGNSLDDLILEVLQNNFDCGNTYGYKVADEIIGLLPSVTPQEPRWILTTERLPKDRDWYLGIFKEPDTGWINPLPFVCDYVGSETKATTKEYWILRGFTDRDEKIDYYFNLECVAWMPLPESFEPQESEEI